MYQNIVLTIYVSSAVCTISAICVSVAIKVYHYLLLEAVLVDSNLSASLIVHVSSEKMMLNPARVSKYNEVSIVNLVWNNKKHVSIETSSNIPEFKT